MGKGKKRLQVAESSSEDDASDIEAAPPKAAPADDGDEEEDELGGPSSAASAGASAGAASEDEDGEDEPEGEEAEEGGEDEDEEPEGEKPAEEETPDAKMHKVLMSKGRLRANLFLSKLPRCSVCRLHIKPLTCPRCKDHICLPCGQMPKDSRGTPENLPKARTSSRENMYKELFPTSQEEYKNLPTYDFRVLAAEMEYTAALDVARKELMLFKKLNGKAQYMQAKQERKALNELKNKKRVPKNSVSLSEVVEANAPAGNDGGSSSSEDDEGEPEAEADAPMEDVQEEAEPEPEAHGEASADEEDEADFAPPAAAPKGASLQLMPPKASAPEPAAPAAAPAPKPASAPKGTSIFAAGDAAQPPVVVVPFVSEQALAMPNAPAYTPTYSAPATAPAAPAPSQEPAAEPIAEPAAEAAPARKQRRARKRKDTLAAGVAEFFLLPPAQQMAFLALLQAGAPAAETVDAKLEEIIGEVVEEDAEMAE